MSRLSIIPNYSHTGRLLKETGRLSISPVFVVGIYSGGEKLGEGFGSSLKIAEFRVRGICVLEG